jgi:hypothetical protein
MSKIIAIVRLVESDFPYLLQQILRRTLAQHKHQPRIHSRLLRPNIMPIRVLCIKLEVVRPRHLARDHCMRRLCILPKEEGPEVLLFGSVDHGHRNGFVGIPDQQCVDVFLDDIGQGLVCRWWCVSVRWRHGSGGFRLTFVRSNGPRLLTLRHGQKRYCSLLEFLAHCSWIEKASNQWARRCLASLRRCILACRAWFFWWLMRQLIIALTWWIWLHCSWIFYGVICNSLEDRRTRCAPRVGEGGGVMPVVTRCRHNSCPLCVTTPVPTQSHPFGESISKRTARNSYKINMTCR